MGGAASCARRLLVLLRNTNNRKLTQSIDRSIDRLRASGLRAGPYLGAGPGQDLSTRKATSPTDNESLDSSNLPRGHLPRRREHDGSPA